MLEAARSCDAKRVFWPSAIAVFGPLTPEGNVPEDTVARPTTTFGVSTVSRELLCDYYVRRYGLDGRGVRYPRGNISETLPGIGTTDTQPRRSTPRSAESATPA